MNANSIRENYNFISAGAIRVIWKCDVTCHFNVLRVRFPRNKCPTCFYATSFSAFICETSKKLSFCGACSQSFCILKLGKAFRKIRSPHSIKLKRGKHRFISLPANRWVSPHIHCYDFILNWEWYEISIMFKST